LRSNGFNFKETRKDEIYVSTTTKVRHGKNDSEIFGTRNIGQCAGERISKLERPERAWYEGMEERLA